MLKFINMPTQTIIVNLGILTIHEKFNYRQYRHLQNNNIFKKINNIYWHIFCFRSGSTSKSGCIGRMPENISWRRLISPNICILQGLSMRFCCLYNFFCETKPRRRRSVSFSFKYTQLFPVIARRQKL